MRPSFDDEASITIEDFLFDGGDGVDLIDIEVDVYYSLAAYDPGCWRTSNGDGWPPSGGGIDCAELSALSANRNGVKLSAEDLAKLDLSLQEKYDNDEGFRAWIDSQCLEHAIDKEASKEFDRWDR